MNVYLLVHDDRMYDMGDSYVRGVYADRATAEAAIVTRTPSGRRSEAYDAHNESCCGVHDEEVLTAPTIDVKDEPPPFTGKREFLIPNGLIDFVLSANTAPNPYRGITARHTGED